MFSPAKVVSCTYLTSFTDSISVSKMGHRKWLNCPLSGQHYLIQNAPEKGPQNMAWCCLVRGQLGRLQPIPTSVLTVKSRGGHWNNIYMPASILFTSFQIKMVETGRHHDGINVGYAFFTVLHFEQRHLSGAGRVSSSKGHVCSSFSSLIWPGTGWQSSSKLFVLLQRRDTYSVSDIFPA